LMNRIYLDNAATTWPKPEEVYTAIDRYMRDNGAPAGRGAYAHAIEVEGTLAAARSSLARLIGASDSRQIIFASSGTDAVNLVIHGLLRPGDHAICTTADHNSVLRPLRHLEDAGQIQVTRIACNNVGWIDPDDVRRALKPNTRLVAMTHASNVTGIVEPLAEIGAIVKQHGARFLVDAAQSLGHFPIDVDQLHADFLAAPGHKGLLGPLGTGVLYIRPGREDELQSIREGGTGTDSGQDRQPNSLPYKFEPGNHNVPGLVGLAAALRWLENRGLKAIHDHEQQLAARLRNGLWQIPGVKFHGPSSADSASVKNTCNTPAAVGVVSVSIEGYDPQEAAGVLDASFGVQVRAGLHCAPLIHRMMGRMEQGGTVRFSIGPFNVDEHIDAAIAAVAKMTSTT
jgi:cysteine desulfurase family protein